MMTYAPRSYLRGRVPRKKENMPKFGRFALLVLLTMGLVAGALASACGPGTRAPSPTPGMAEVQELRVNLAGEPATIDPNKASWIPERTVIMQVFEGLLGFNQDLELVPVVAKQIPSVSNGGISQDSLTYIFHLRNDVLWSDGQPVTAYDFEYSVKRLLSPELSAPYASFYYDIAGAHAYNSGVGSIESVAVKAIDDYTLQFTLVSPRYTFLHLVALWPAYPIRQDIITEYGDRWTEPGTYVGNGPFIMTAWVHQDHITLERNPRYWGTPPKLARITMSMITDQSVEYAAYLNNELDISRVPVGMEASIMKDSDLSLELVRFPRLVTFGLLFNVTKPPFDQKQVRQAFSMAVDRAALVDKVRSGVGKVAYSWIPPGMPGHQPDLGLEYAFDADKAKQMLVDAGYPNGAGLPSISFEYPDTAGSKVTAEFVHWQILNNLGVDISLEPMEPKAFSQYVNANHHMWAFSGWGADYPDPDNWLPELFRTGAGNNHTLYSNPEFDALVDQAMAEPNYEPRMALWRQAQQIVVEDAPVIFLFYPEKFVLAKPYVKDLKTTAMDGQIVGDLFFKETYLLQH